MEGIKDESATEEAYGRNLSLLIQCEMQQEIRNWASSKRI